VDYSTVKRRLWFLGGVGMLLNATNLDRNPGYVGRKRWTKPNHSFSFRTNRLFIHRPSPEFSVRSSRPGRVCALFRERRMKFREPTKLHRKSGMWGTRLLLRGWRQERVLA